MELTFVTNAIRRYWWLVVVVTLLGLAPGLLKGTDPVGYESRAVLLLSQPSDASGMTSADPDRYVNSQISVLSSDALAENVAARLDDGSSAGAVRSSITIQHQPETDIVQIVVKTPDPKRSQAVGNAYIEEYFAALSAQVESAQEPEITKLNEEIAAIREQISEVDEASTAAMAPYLGRETVPDLVAIAPELDTEKGLLVAQYQEKQTALNELDTSARLRVSSETVQAPTLPADPTTPPPNLLLALGLFGGLAAGLFGAVLLARISPRVLGDDQAEEILDHPVIGVMPKLEAANDRAAILGEVPREAIEEIEALCVRIEAAAHERTSLTVVVTGTRYGAGVTTLAAAVARRFAERDARVLLVDADAKDGELATLFTGRPDRSRVKRTKAEGRRRGAEPTELALTAVATADRASATPTDLTNLAVTDFASLAGTTGMQARHVSEVIAAAVGQADVVVFDGGPMLAAASTVQLTRHCDAVVLAMARDQDIRRLDDVADELRDRMVLPVWTPARSGGSLLARLGRRSARR